MKFKANADGATIQKYDLGNPSPDYVATYTEWSNKGDEFSVDNFNEVVESYFIQQILSDKIVPVDESAVKYVERLVDD